MQPARKINTSYKLESAHLQININQLKKILSHFQNWLLSAAPTEINAWSSHRELI